MWVEKLTQYGVSQEEFDSFCKKYPQYASNKELMAKLYLATVKGVKVAQPKIVGEFKKTTELVVGEVSRIRVITVQEVDRRQYVGCPKCLRKLNAGPNTTVECDRCGVARAQVLEWVTVLAGDDAGEVILAFPPSVGNVPQTGSDIAVEGSLTEQGEFIVFRYSTPVVEEAKPTEVTPTPAVAVPPPTPAPQPTFKCDVCGKTFKSDSALRIHKSMAHKDKAVEAVEAPATPTPAPTVGPAVETVQPQPSVPEEVIKLAKAAAIIQKPYEEFKAFVEGKYPGVNIDEALKLAGCKVQDGKVVRE